MRLITSTALALALGLGVLTGCQDVATPIAVEKKPATPATSPAQKAPNVDEHGHEDDAPRITLAEAKKEFDAGSAVFLDTRAEATFKQEHIKGALNIPVEAVDAKYTQIPKGKKIIAYCS